MISPPDNTSQQAKVQYRRLRGLAKVIRNNYVYRLNDTIITQIRRVCLQYSHAEVHERLLPAAKSFLCAIQPEHYQTAIATYNIEKNQLFIMAQSWLVRAQEEAF
jgi:hypothetical protein